MNMWFRVHHRIGREEVRIMVEWWFDAELSGCRLGDDRLDRRLRQLVERMEVGFGGSIPLACQD